MLDSCSFKNRVCISQTRHISSCSLWFTVWSIEYLVAKIFDFTNCGFLLYYHFCERQSSLNLDCSNCFGFFALWNILSKLSLQVPARVDAHEPLKLFINFKSYFLGTFNRNKVEIFPNGWQQVEIEKEAQHIVHLCILTTAWNIVSVLSEVHKLCRTLGNMYQLVGWIQLKVRSVTPSTQWKDLVKVKLVQ